MILTLSLSKPNADHRIAELLYSEAACLAASLYRGSVILRLDVSSLCSIMNKL